MAIFFLMSQNSESLNFIESSRTRTVDKTILKKGTGRQQNRRDSG